MKISLYSRISLDRDFLEYNLKKEDIATFIDTVPDPEDIEEGYILEVFNALGELINPVIVPPSAVVPLRSDEILSVRSLVTNELHGSLNSNKIMKLLKDLCKPLGLKKKRAKCPHYQ